MTIGIATFGPGAGLAAWTALRAAERVGTGAIGGFVSLAVIGADGALHRAETQRGGAAALFGGDAVPPPFAAARHAVLMSSGPDRPAPLSQFTPADAAVGLVTGHRMPNTPGAGGQPLNEEVLRRMAAGASPEQAVARVVADNPTADAGFIALALNGRLHAADTAYLAAFGDAGAARLGTAGEGAAVAVLHNAIRPHRALALLVAEIAHDVMVPPGRPDGHVTLAAGVPVETGEGNALRVDGAGRVRALRVADPRYQRGRWSLGLGYRAPVEGDAGTVGVALYEPYLVVAGGRLESIDGAPSFELPIRTAAAGAATRTGSGGGGTPDGVPRSE